MASSLPMSKLAHKKRPRVDGLTIIKTLKKGLEDAIKKTNTKKQLSNWKLMRESEPAVGHFLFNLNSHRGEKNERKQQRYRH